MKARSYIIALTMTAALSSTGPVLAQTASIGPSTPMAASAPTAVPSIVPFTAIATSNDGATLTGEADITFQIYKDESGGEALWTETQTVAIDTTGHYKVQLGGASPNGLPSDLFSSGEARWLGVQIAGQMPQSRILLASVPYALKAADAATLGGLPASAYALAGSGGIPAHNATAAGITPDSTSTVTTTGGTAGYIPEFSGAATIVDSPVFILGADVGIGTITPTATLDVNGTALISGALTANGGATVGGSLVLPATGTATASAGFDSQLLKMYTSAYNSSTKAAVDPRFEWEAVETGNDTASPTATLQLLASNGPAGVAATGFSFNTNGTLNFAPGQTFPGAGSGTITGVTAGTGLTGGGTVGDVILNLDTTKVPELAGANVFTGSSNDFNTSITIDYSSLNNGFLVPGILFGADTGEGIASNRNSGNRYGLDFFTDDKSRLSITNAGLVGVGISTPAYGMEVYNSAASAAQLAMVSKGTDAAISVNNVADGGREYWIDSGSGSAGIGAGNFAIYDKTADATRLVVTSSGEVGIGTLTPDFPLEVDGSESTNGYPFLAVGAYEPSQKGGFDGVLGYGGNAGPTGATGGAGAYFTGGDADTISDAGYGLTAYGGFSDNLGEAPSGYFSSDIIVNGNTVSNVSSSMIDHPLDPANKYLVHASVQSSEMMNMYTGNVTTDELGLATIQLPSWFEAENTDFRYQLTTIGRDAHAWVAQKVQDGKFQIATNATNVEVSWQITAVRQDAYAKANPLVVEQEKPAKEVGYYLHPELFGQPRQKQTQWGRNPKMMQRMEAQRAAIKARQANGRKSVGDQTHAELELPSQAVPTAR